MKPHNPKAIADKYYGDAFSRKIRDGKRCCLFGPSIFKGGFGGATLLIDKESLTSYEIYSGMMRYGDLPFLDYENQLGLFHWPSEGGAPIADDEKILLKQITDLRQSKQSLREEDAKLLALRLTELASRYLKSKNSTFAEAEKVFLEAVTIQLQYPKLFLHDARSPINLYLQTLRQKGRNEDVQLLEAQWQAAESAAALSIKKASEVTAAVEVDVDVENTEAGGNVEAEQLLFDAADAEDANNQKLAEDLYNKAINVLLKDESSVTRDSFLMLAYSALGHLLVGQKKFLEATKLLASSITFYQSSKHRQELLLTGTICVQILGECLTNLGRTDELAALAEVLDQTKK